MSASRVVKTVLSSVSPSEIPARTWVLWAVTNREAMQHWSATPMASTVKAATSKVGRVAGHELVRGGLGSRGSSAG